MIEINVTIQHADLLPAYQVLIEQALPYTYGFIQPAAQPVIDEMLPQLQREPGPAAKPFHWTSAKQRRAYFATNGFGHGIPYVRTHGLSRGYRITWQKALSDNSIKLVVQNEAKTVWQFVKGPYQQTGHWYTGWDSDAANFQYYRDKLWLVIVPAVKEAWSPENVMKMAGVSQVP